MKNKNAKFCGIDIGCQKHTVAILDAELNVLKKYPITNTIEGFRKVERNIHKGTKMCIEPTGVYSVNFLIYFYRRGFDIRLAGTKSSKYLRQSLNFGRKHDKFDCKVLAQYRLSHEHKTLHPDRILQGYSYDNCDAYLLKLQNKLFDYRKYSRKISNIKKKLTNIIDLRFPEASLVFPGLRGGKTIIKALVYSKEDILSRKIKLLRGEKIREQLRKSIGQYDYKKKYFKILVDELKRLEYNCEELSKSMNEHLLEGGYGSLFNYSGLNTINITTILTNVQNITRFYKYKNDGVIHNKKSLLAFKSFIGLAVTTNQSGDHEGLGRLVKSGCLDVRGVLWMLALTYIASKNKKIDENSKYNAFNPAKYKTLYEAYTQRTKKGIAIPKIMNKISTDLFFALKEISDAKEAAA